MSTIIPLRDFYHKLCKSIYSTHRVAIFASVIATLLLLCTLSRQSVLVTEVSSFTRLAWDDSGLSLYDMTRRKLAAGLVSRNDSLLHYATIPLGEVTSHNVEGVPGGRWLKDNIDGLPNWEAQSFETFLLHAEGHDTYVDFGSWIGPTLFFCAQLFSRSFAVEADPVAYASVFTTLQLNSDKIWSKRIKLQPGGVGPGSELDLKPVQVSMQSASAGNSCSGMGSKVNCGEVKDHWKVNTYKLPALFQHWKITGSNTFVKVDVEAFECALVPSWIPWLRGMSIKPTFFISFHAYVIYCTDEEYTRITEFAKLFKRVLNQKEEEVELLDSFENLKGAALIFTDK